MRLEKLPTRATLWSIAVPVGGLGIWTLLWLIGRFPESLFPAPWAVALALAEEVRTGRLWDDLVASLFRVGAGFELAAIVGIPVGVLLGHRTRLRGAFVPAVNFFRNLSPLAWLPFAVLWFGIGDVPAIFLIFLSAVFPLALSATVAVGGIPAVYFQVARDHGIHGWALVTHVTLPAILPQLITALRLTAGLSWVVLVAAEMLAGRDGLGFAIYDARNGLRIDIVVCEMIVIGVIGVVLDRMLAGLTRIPSVRWGYER
jgi:NitT/TauT family transport system permease protein